MKTPWQLIIASILSVGLLVSMSAEAGSKGSKNKKQKKILPSECPVTVQYIEVCTVPPVDPPSLCVDPVSKITIKHTPEYEHILRSWEVWGADGGLYYRGQGRSVTLNDLPGKVHIKYRGAFVMSISVNCNAVGQSAPLFEVTGAE